MHEPPNDAERQDRSPDTNLVPDSFNDDYVQYVLKPFFLSGIYLGEKPVLPMIDLNLTKERAIPAHLFGMLYKSWEPYKRWETIVEEEGTSVFLQGYENRGRNNERKKIYYSALTPDLYGEMYAGKIERFLDQLFHEQNVGKPLMEQYYKSYFDMYWDLHLGVRGNDIPPEIRDIGNCFMNVLGYWHPILQKVHNDYMQVRDLRDTLRDWIDKRAKDVFAGKISNPEETFVYYWDKNRGRTDNPNFRDQDIVFECFHNFLAFSQWGHTLYRIMERLMVDGDQSFQRVRDCFKETMRLEAESDPNDMDTPAFTPLDRFVMELFRTISPNGGSISSLPARAQFFGEGYTGFNTIITPHLETSSAPYHWDDPKDFNPDRYKTATTSKQETVTTSEQNDETKVEKVRLARCPFSKEPFAVKDGRQAKVEVTNSAFGTVYAEIGDEAYPVCDEAGYAPFGFGYRRCAGELLTVEFVKDLLRKVWDEKIEFRRLSFDPANPAERRPVAPNMVVDDNVGFGFKKEQ